MRKILSFTILFLFCLINAETVSWEQEIERLLKYDLVEPTSLSFSDIKYSRIFIDQFNLNLDEISLVGEWLVNNDVPGQERAGNIIGTLIFYPNRIFVINLTAPTDFANVLTGKWKIENAIVYLESLFTFTMIYYRFPRLLKYTVLPQKNPVSIGKAEYESKAVIQKNPWDFSKIDFSSIDKDMKLEKDYVRYRIIKEHNIPTEFQRLETQEKLRTFYLNPAYNDIDYLFQLFCTHGSGFDTTYEWKDKQ